MQVLEHAGSHQLGMERRDAVDPVRAHKSEVPHPDPPPFALVDQRDLGQEIGVESARPPRCLEVTRIDRVDDFEMPREKALEQRHRPTLQCFRQQRVVGVGECLDGDPPGLVPRHVVQIDEDAHQLGDRDARMRVVELDSRPLRKRIDAAESSGVAAHEVLQRGRHEEIFLTQPQFAP